MEARLSRMTVVAPQAGIVHKLTAHTVGGVSHDRQWRQCVHVHEAVHVLHEVAEDEMILDLGPQAVEALADVLKTCRTLVWNGPLGAFETEPFDMATVSQVRNAAGLTLEGSLISVAGGGDTVAALAQAGVAEDFSYVSTAGGAFLEWMEGRVLPGVAALEA
jgi:phosphoglycerate kinase